MGQIIVRNLDDEVIAKLKERATACRSSLEQTVRMILTQAVDLDREAVWSRIDAVRESIGPVVGDSAPLIREDRDRR